MTPLTILTWIVFVLCLTLSFLLSGMEAGVFALSRLRVRQQMRAGRSSARLLYSFLENPENFLWTIVVGNTIVNFCIFGWIVPGLHDLVGGQHLLFAVSFIVIVFLFYTLFDLLPKMIFRKFPNRLCMYFAKPFKFVYLGLRPFVVLVEQSSAFLLRWTGGKTFTGRLFGNREELRLVMQESAQDLTSEERAMINHVMDLQTITVRQITTPLQQIPILNAQMPTSEALKLVRERGLVRSPVWETRDGKRRVIGLVVLDSLLYQTDLDVTKPLAVYIRPALFLEEDMRLEVALRRMQRGGHRLAVVLGRDGLESGVVSLEDILKVIFGEVKL